MTYPVATAGEQLLVLVGDGASPENFTPFGLINLDRSLELSANAIATMVPNTSNPSLPGKTVRAVESVDWKVTGSCILDLGQDKLGADWLLSGAAKNIEVINNQAGGLTLKGPAVLTQFTPTGKNQGKVTASVTLEGADLPTASTT